MHFSSLDKSLTILALSSVAVLFSHLFVTTSAAGSFEAACEKGVTSDNRTLNTCDSSKFLTCREGRCLCNDPTNQIWGSRRSSSSNSNSNSTPSLISLILSRTKRAKGGFRRPSKPKLPSRPKTSSGSSNVAGIAAGAGAGYLAGSLVNSGKITSLLSSESASTTSRPSTSTGAGSRQRVYGCYSRAGVQCVLENAGDQANSTTASSSSSSTTTTTEATTTNSSSTTTTTSAPTSSSTESSTKVTGGQEVTLEILMTTPNSTSDAVSTETTTSTTTPSTVSSSSPSTASESSTDSTSTSTSTTTEASSTSTSSPLDDFSKIPKCIEYAECRLPEVKIVDGKVVSGGESPDSKLGVCTCIDGYQRNSQDICVRK